jgi:hypothetical protein
VAAVTRGCWPRASGVRIDRRVPRGRIFAVGIRLDVCPAIPVLTVVDGILGGLATDGRLPHGVDFDLATQVFHDAFQLAKALHQLNLALARLLRGRIRVFRSRSSRGSAGGGENALYLCLATIAARHVLIASNLPPPTCDATARIQGRGGRLRGIESDGAAGCERQGGPAVSIGRGK